jgi:hypothetical protein
VGLVVGTFDSVGIYPFNRNRVPEYFFSISGTSGIITSMENAPPNMTVVCISSTSVTNSKYELPVSAEPSLSTLSTTIHSTTSP